MSIGDATRADIEKELTKLIEAAREELACGNQFGYEALHEQIDLLLTDQERVGVKA